MVILVPLSFIENVKNACRAMKLGGGGGGGSYLHLLIIIVNHFGHAKIVPEKNPPEMYKANVPAWGIFYQLLTII